MAVAKKSSSKGIGLDMPPPMKMSTSQRAQENRYRAESDLRTLREAEQVKSDPARVRMAKIIAKEEIKALSKVAKK